MAELAAREMGWVPLREALALVTLYAAKGDPRFERAAARWLGRLTAERPELTIQEIQFAAAALQGMAARPDSRPEVWPATGPRGESVQTRQTPPERGFLAVGAPRFELGTSSPTD